MMKIYANTEMIMIEGANNHIIMDGSYRHGREFTVVDEKKDVDHSEFVEVVCEEGNSYVLNSCYHTDGGTVEKVCYKDNKLVFFSEVDECRLTHYETTTYVVAGYDISKGEFYDYWECSDEESKELELIVESMQVA